MRFQNQTAYIPIFLQHKQINQCNEDAVCLSAIGLMFEKVNVLRSIVAVVVVVVVVVVVTCSSEGDNNIPLRPRSRGISLLFCLKTRT